MLSFIVIFPTVFLIHISTVPLSLFIIFFSLILLVEQPWISKGGGHLLQNRN